MPKLGNFYVTAFEIPILNKLDVIIMNNCIHNEIKGIHNRYLKKTPSLGELDGKIIDRIIDELEAKMRPHFDSHFDVNEFMSDKKGALGNRYKAAANALIKDGFSLEGDSDIAAFVKLEKFSEMKAPRMILGRNPKFNILYAKYVQPLERAFFELEEVCNKCNYAQCGEKFGKLKGGWYIENDMSKFEASQRIEMLLNIEYRLYKRFFPHDDTFDKLFAAKVIKKIRTANGVFIKFIGCRGSGDMDTSLGNGVLNYVACRYFQIYNGIDGFGLMLKGDDSVMGAPSGRVDYKNTFINFGFDAKLVVRKVASDVEFCSGKFIMTTPSVYYYVQNLNKILSNIPTIINNRFFTSMADYFYSLGYMYSVIYKGIPVYQDMAEFLMSCGPNKRVKTDMLLDHFGAYEAFKSNREQVEVDYNLAISEIMMAFDISMVEINHLKDYFSQKLVIPPCFSKPYKCVRTNRLHVEPVLIAMSQVRNPAVHSRDIWKLLAEQRLVPR